MKSRESGFTLIELMLVVALIGILVSIAIPAAFNARKEARIAIARQQIADIMTAVESYFQEYGKLPSKTQSEDIVEVLAGVDKNENPRKIAFLNVVDSDDDNWDGECEDPWGRQYDIYLDDDYNRVISFEGSSVTNEMAVVISAGPDRILESGDDLMSIPIPSDWK